MHIITFHFALDTQGVLGRTLAGIEFLLFQTMNNGFKNTCKGIGKLYLYTALL